MRSGTTFGAADAFCWPAAVKSATHRNKTKGTIERGLFFMDSPQREISNDHSPGPDKTSSQLMVCGNEKTFHTSRTLRVLCMLGSEEHRPTTISTTIQDLTFRWGAPTRRWI